MSKTTVIASLSGLTAVIVTLLVMFYGGRISSGGLAAVSRTFGTQDVYQEQVIRELRPIYQDTELREDDLEVREIDLNKDGRSDLVVKVVHEDVCGSAGCPHELFLKNESAWERLTFGYSGKDLNVKQTITDGYLDLEINGVEFAWDGVRYTPRDRS